MREPRRVRVAALGFAGGLAAIGLTACASTQPVVSAASLSARVAQEQRARTPDLAVGDVTCTRLVAKPGRTASCTVRVDSVEVPVRATYDGPDAVTLTPERAAIDLVRAEQAVLATLADTTATVSCGPAGAKVLLADPGDTFTCAVRHAGSSDTVTYRVLDVDGTVRKVG